jgi:hypothetical protein
MGASGVSELGPEAMTIPLDHEAIMSTFRTEGDLDMI